MSSKFKEQPKPKGHNFNGRLLAWPYCLRCGLVCLNNRRTEKEIKRVCPADLD